MDSRKSVMRRWIATCGEAASAATTRATGHTIHWARMLSASGATGLAIRMNTMQKTLQTSRRFRTRCFQTLGLTVIGLASGALATTPVLGQDAPSKTPITAKPTTQPSSPPTARTHPNQPTLWDVDQMMEDAVLQITRRYNLNKAQENYTRLLLTERVREFLDDYEADVRELLQQSIDMRANRVENGPKALMDWAIRAAPLYEGAKNAILDGNEEWGQILDPEQKKTHDRDLALMRTNFVNVARTLDTWMDGKGKMPGARPATVAGNGTLARHDNRVSEPAAAVTTAQAEDNWMAYVTQFIAAYKLDDKQQIAAREKIHKVQIARARQYRQKQKKKFDEITTLLAAKDGKITTTELNRRRRELERPIHKLFINLDRRLQALPNTKQKAETDEVLKKKLEATYKVLAGLVGPAKAAAKAETKLKPDKPVKQVEGEAKDQKPKQVSPKRPVPKKPAPKVAPRTPPRNEKAPDAENENEADDDDEDESDDG